MTENKQSKVPLAGIGSFFHTEEGMEACKMDISAITHSCTTPVDKP